MDMFQQLMEEEGCLFIKVPVGVRNVRGLGKEWIMMILFVDI